MGNTPTKTRVKNERVVRVAKPDGKTLEFHAPVVVKDLLTSHPNCFVGAFKETTQPLPPNYWLRVGRMYYIMPLLEKPNDCNTRKIKVVITKQQLTRILANQTSFEEVILDSLNGSSGSRKRRMMDTIPEGIESS